MAPRITKVFGPPGTGKTTWMLNRLENIIDEGVDVGRIAYLTFSVSAREEAKSRALERLPLVSPDKFKYFKTIHGICFSEMDIGRQHVMQTDDYLDFAKYCGTHFSQDYTDELDQTGTPFGWSTSIGNAYMNIRQLAAATMMEPTSQKFMDAWWPEDVNVDSFKQIMMRYEEYKQDKIKFDFVDMLHMFMKSGSSLPVTHVFVDEAQDLSELQWFIVEIFCRNAKQLYLAGDDDQAIYSFIGASQYGFLDREADETIVLDKSYRLRSNIWKFANRIISQVGRRQAKIVSTRSDGGSVNWWGLSPEELVERIDLNDVLIISPTNIQLARIQSRLEERGVSHTYKGKSPAEAAMTETFYWYHRARKGDSIPILQAARLLRILKLEAAKAMTEQARLTSGDFISKAVLTGHGVRWIAGRDSCTYVSTRNSHVRTNLSAFDIALKSQNIEAMLEKPRVRLTTYHGSKGLEANSVILLTDCSKPAVDYADKNPDYERRLAYVGVTRAKEELHIAQPQTNHHMRAFT